MNRRAPLLLVALCAIIAVVALLLHHLSGPSGPQLWLLGYTNAPDITGPAALLCFSNSTRHQVYLNGPSAGSPFYSREAYIPPGWRPVDSSTRPASYYDWLVAPGKTCVFTVPALTNQPNGWRVTVRYFDGAQIVKLPMLPLTTRVPGKGSGRYLDASTGTLTRPP
jgi:hypothetical protein